jgi:glutamyl-tRNA reductase
MNQFVFSVASFAYPQVSGDARSMIASRIETFRRRDVFTLSTCLRIEIAVPGDADDLRRLLKEMFDGLDIDVDEALLSGRPAVEHVYRVAAGLESPVLGEPEILTQFRQALAAADIRHGLFRKLLENSVAVGRGARELLPFNPHESLAAVAAQMVGHAERVAVLGSGIMATAVAEALKQLPSPPVITMAARTTDAVKVVDVEVVNIDERIRLLREEPAVISATSARTELVSSTDLADALAGRASILTLIDMAMPPDFSRPSDSTVSYIDIDGLAERAARRARSDAADSFVTEAAEAMHRRISVHDTTGPFIKHLMDGADEVVERVLERFAGRLTSASDTAVLRQTAHAVARALLARPVAAIRESPTPEAISAADAFGFDV